MKIQLQKASLIQVFKPKTLQKTTHFLEDVGKSTGSWGPGPPCWTASLSSAPWPKSLRCPGRPNKRPGLLAQVAGWLQLDCKKLAFALNLHSQHFPTYVFWQTALKLCPVTGWAVVPGTATARCAVTSSTCRATATRRGPRSSAPRPWTSCATGALEPAAEYWWLCVFGYISHWGISENEFLLGRFWAWQIRRVVWMVPMSLSFEFLLDATRLVQTNRKLLCSRKQHLKSVCQDGLNLSLPNPKETWNVSKL